jgi:SAM-dependent methyltransferase
MPRIRPFEEHLDEYENWFVENRLAYESELEAVRAHLPEGGRGLEIGVGSGLFAQPLGIGHGVEPSPRMRSAAAGRGIQVVEGVAEDLPFDDGAFDFALMVTTICFVDDARTALEEARRVVRPGGRVVVGLVDRDSPVGRSYQEHQEESVFYRDATFFTTEEVLSLMETVGLVSFRITQTLFHPLDQITAVEEFREGYGQGSFVVLSGKKEGSTDRLTGP